ncbi:hypothetical protein [Sphingosinicella terrae]|uniref:hypothetical protein n=1 Tax=Sphingosinicella terrae TaxID=2172047 RepID=UPI000E0D47AA|nr:hypothetical protein [Sphingosinicella terrae]
MIRRLAFCLAVAMAGCAGPAPARTIVLDDFSCANGTRFGVEYKGGEARLLTAGSAHRLLRRPSSIGRKFVDGDVTLIVDEDRAALNGVQGESFRQCRRIGHRRTAMGGGD